MKAVDLRSRSVDELNSELESLLKEHFTMRIQLSMQQFTKTSDFKRVKRDIARVKTVLREKVA